MKILHGQPTKMYTFFQFRITAPHLLPCTRQMSMKSLIQRKVCRGYYLYDYHYVGNEIILYIPPTPQERTYFTSTIKINIKMKKRTKTK